MALSHPFLSQTYILLTLHTSLDSVMAANMMPFFVIMCELFNGVLRSQDEMPVFWAYTMYYVAPFTYWIGGILSAILAGQPVTCTASELVSFDSPPGITCADYARSFLESGAGYLANPEAMGVCRYCPYSVGDDVSIPFGFLLYMISGAGANLSLVSC